MGIERTTEVEEHLLSYRTPKLDRWRQTTDAPLLVIAIASLPLLLLEFARSDLPPSDGRFLDIVNVVVLAAFAIDYGVELCLASHRALFARMEWISLAIGGSIAREGRAIIRRKAGTFALLLAGFVWLTSAVAFTLAEGVGAGHVTAHSFFDALWWSAATITTVGYGDIYPITSVGRAIGMVTMVVGVATFAVVTAKIAQFLVQDDAALE